MAFQQDRAVGYSNQVTKEMAQRMSEANAHAQSQTLGAAQVQPLPPLPQTACAFEDLNQVLGCLWNQIERLDRIRFRLCGPMPESAQESAPTPPPPENLHSKLVMLVDGTRRMEHRFGDILSHLESFI